MVFSVLATSPSGVKALRGASRRAIRRQVKENKRTPSPTLVPTFNPTAHPTVDPSPSPTPQPTVVVALTLKVELLPFSLGIAEPLGDEAAFTELLERYLFYSMRGGVSSLESVTLEKVPMYRRHLEESSITLIYRGTATVTDLFVEEQFVQSAQIAVLEETRYLQEFIVQSDAEATILQVQAGDREAILIRDPNSADTLNGGLNGGTIGGAVAASLVIVVAFALFLRYQRNKPPPPPPYQFEEDSNFSFEDAMDIAKSRTAETEPDHASPPKSLYSGSALAANCTVHENHAGDGMEIVATELSNPERLVELIPSPLNSYRRSQEAPTPSRCRSATSSVTSRSSLDPPSISRSSTEPYYLPRLKQSEYASDLNSAFATIDTTKCVISPSRAALSFASSIMEDSVDDEFVTFDNEGTMYARSPSSHHQSHSAQTVLRRNPQQLVRVKSEESERHYDPQRKWFHQPSIQTSKSDDHMTSDSTASTLENILNPVRNPTAASNQAIEVFVDSSTDGSDSDDENSRCLDNRSWMRDVPVLSKGYLSNANSFASEPSDQRIALAVSSENHRSRGCISSRDDCVNAINAVPVVSPTSWTSPGDASCIQTDAPSDGESKSVQSHHSFDYSQDESIYSDQDVFDEYPPAQTKSPCLETASLGSRGVKSASSLVSVDSASHFDPVFISELRQERRRVKNATRKLQSERTEAPFSMDI